MTSGRNADGKFAAGNPGGPGRPPRAIEFQYLARLGDAVGLDDWQRIVEKAKEDALSGDSRAREWLARYLLGDPPPKTLLDLAVMARDQAISDAAARIINTRHTDEGFFSALCKDIAGAEKRRTGGEIATRGVPDTPYRKGTVKSMPTP